MINEMTVNLLGHVNLPKKKEIMTDRTKHETKRIWSSGSIFLKTK